LLNILELAADNRVVTTIEVLGPNNKTPGPGLDAFKESCKQKWESGSNLVEIDLLRQGTTTIRLTTERLEAMRPWNYLVGVTRRQPSQQEVYAVRLHHRLPRIRIPLAADFADVSVDLQAVFTRCWDEGPYPELLRYDYSPLGPMAAEEVAWCENLLGEAGYRTPPTTNGIT